MEKIRVIHVDDDEDFLEIFRLQFGKWFDITSLADPLMVFDELKRNTYHALISDFEMPVMNGLDLLKSLKKESFHLPFIFYTGQGNEQIAREAFVSGAVDYFTKDIFGFAHRDRFVNTVKMAVEKVLSEEALHESQRNFQHLVENINDVIYVVDSHGILTYVSPVVENVLEYTPEEIVGKNFIALVYQDDKEKLQKRFRELLLGDIRPFEYRVVKKSGKICWVSSFTKPYYKRGKEKEFLGVLTDITERKRAEEELRRSQKEWKTIFESIGHATLILDPQHKIIEANRTALIMTGKTRKDLIGKNCYEVFHNPDAHNPPHQCPLTTLLSRFPTYTRDMKTEEFYKTVEMEMEALNGTFLVSCTPVFDDEGKLQKIIHISTDITARKKAEEELKISKQKYRDLTDFLPQAVYECDLEANLTFVNRYDFEEFGYTPEDLEKGMNVLELILPEERPRAMERIKRLLSGKGNSGGEYTIIRKDGSLVPVIIYGSPIIHGGKIEGFRGVIINIAERKKFEEELRVSEERYRLVAEQTGQMVYDLDMATGRVLWTGAIEEITGFTNEEYQTVTYKTWEDFIHPDERTQTVELFNETMRTGSRFTAEYRLRRKDGSYTYVEDNGVFLRDEKGNLTRMLGSMKDISERKEAERLIRQKNQEIDRFFNVALDLFCIADTDGYFRRVCVQWERTLGYKTEELENHSFLDLVHPDDIQGTLDVMKDLSDQKEVPNFVNRYRCKDGSWRQLEWRSFPIGNLIYASARDITDKKKAEEQILKLNRIYAIISDVNQTIVRVRREEELLKEICRIAVKHGKFDRVWIGMIKEKPGIIEPVAYEGITPMPEDLCISLTEGTPVAHALNEGKHYVNNRVISGDRIGSHAVFPLKKYNKPVGALSLCYPEADFFDDDEIRLLDEIAIDISFALESIETEKALIQSEAKYRSLVRYSSDPIFAFDENRNYSFVSEAFARPFGKTPEEIIGKSPYFIFSKEEAEKRLRIVDAVFNTGETHKIEVEVITHTGEKNYYLTSADPIKDKDGKVVSVSCISRNITERKRMEDALRESELRQRIILDSIPDLVWMKDRENRVIAVNKAFAIFLGRKFGEIVGKTNQELFDPETAGKFDRDDRQVMEEGKIKSMRETVKYPDGSFACYETVKTPVRNYQGEIVGTVGVARDITARSKYESDIFEFEVHRKEMEKAVLESEEKFRTIFDFAMDGIALANIDDKKFFMVNRSFKEMLGYEDDEIIGFTIDKIHPLKDYPYVREQFEKQTRKEIITAKDIPLIRKDGEIIYSDVNSSPIEIKNKKYLLGIFRDITERKKMEEELEKSRAKWQALVESVPAVIATLNKEGIITFINRTTIGKPVEEILGTSLYNYLPPEERERLRNIIEDVFERGTTYNYPIRITRPDGTVVWYDNNVGPVREKGKVVSVVLISIDITPMKRTEEALREREANLNAVFDSAGIAIALIDTKGKMLRFNSVCEELLGYNAEELINLTSLDFTHPHDLTLTKKYMKEMLTGEIASYRTEKRYIRKNGETRWVSMSINPIKDDGGQILAFIVAGADITRHKEIEEELKRSEEKYRRMVDTALEGIWGQDENQMTTFANQRMAEMLGVKIEDMMDRGVTDFMFTGDIDVYEERMKIRAKGEGGRYEQKFRRADGSPVWCIVSATPIMDEGGNFKGSFALLTDISDKKRVEDELLKSRGLLGLKNRIDNLFLTISDANIYSEVLKEILNALESPDGFFGYINEEEQFVLHNLEETRIVPVIPFMQRQESFMSNAPISVPIGHLTINKVIFTPLIHRDKTIGFLTVANKDNDYTQEDLNLLEDIAFSIAPVLDVRLQRERMEKELKDRNRELSDFTYRVSHDLKSPINIMGGFIEIIERKPEYFSQYMPRVKDQIRTANAFINNLLSLSRAGKSIGKKVPVHIETLFSRIFVSLDKGELNIESEKNFLLPSITGDPDALFNLFFNIVENSVKYRDQEKEKLHILVESRQEGDWAVVSISDNGIGIQEQDIKNIFLPGFTLAKDKGTGFGLAISKKVVEAHEGQIRAFSEGKGKGTAFVVKLPL